MGGDLELLNQSATVHRAVERIRADVMRLPLEVVRRVRQAAGDDFILIYRLSMLDLVEDGSSWEEVETLAQAIEAAGATIRTTGASSSSSPSTETGPRLAPLPGRPQHTSYEVMCLYGAEEPLALGDLVAARAMCDACTASGIFRPDED